MKTILNFCIVMFVIGMVFWGLSTIDFNKKKQTTQTIPKKEVVKKMSEKEVWYYLLHPYAREFVNVIDSLPISHAFDNEKVSVTRTSDGIWEETQPEDYLWSDNVYNEESGELLKTNRFKGHVGNAYLRSILKEDTWEKIYGNEGGFFTKKYVFQYGVLLKPDTINGKIHPIGTYVVSSSFLSEEEFNQGKKEFKYFSNYEKFLNFVLEKINSSEKFFGDFVSIPRPIRIDISL